MKNKTSVCLKAKAEICEWIEGKINMLENDIESKRSYYEEDNSREWLQYDIAHLEQEVKYLNSLIEKLSTL